MNYTELQQAILDTTHKSNLVGAPVQLCIAQGEGLINANLEAYNLLASINDAQRIVPGQGRYTVANLTMMRYVRIDGLPLDKVDETVAYMNRNSNISAVYAQRVGEILIAAAPAVGTTIDLDYMGKPAALSVTPTNTLLDNVPQLYIDAASHYVFKRSEDYESAQLALDATLAMCRQLSQQVKKLLGGAQPVNVYNTQFRSSY